MTTAWGKVTVPTPGNPVRADVNFPADFDPGTAGSKFHAANAILIQVLPGNTGKIYIGCSANMNKSTWVDVIAWLAVPTANFSPSCSITIPYAVGGVNVKEIFIDADNADEGAIISSVAA